METITNSQLQDNKETVRKTLDSPGPLRLMRCTCPIELFDYCEELYVLQSSTPVPRHVQMFV